MSRSRPPAARAAGAAPLDAGVQWTRPEIFNDAVRAVSAFSRLSRSAEKLEWMAQAASRVASTIAQERKAKRDAPLKPEASCLVMWTHARLFEWIVAAVAQVEHFSDALVMAAAEVVAAFRSLDAVVYAISIALEHLGLTRPFGSLASLVCFVAACIDDMNYSLKPHTSPSGGGDTSSNQNASGAEDDDEDDEGATAREAFEAQRLELLEDVITMLSELLSQRLPYRDEALRLMLSATGGDAFDKRPATPQMQPILNVTSPARRDEIVASVPRLDLGGVSPMPKRGSAAAGRSSSADRQQHGLSATGAGGGKRGTLHNQLTPVRQPPVPQRSVEVGGAARVTDSSVGRVMTFRIPTQESFQRQPAELARRRMVEALLSVGHKAGQLFATGDLSTLLAMKTEYEARRGGALIPLDTIINETGDVPSRTPPSVSPEHLSTSGRRHPAAAHGSGLGFGSDDSSELPTSGLGGTSIYESRARRSTLIVTSDADDAFGGTASGYASGGSGQGSRHLLSYMVIEIVSSVAAHFRAGWTNPFDAVFLLVSVIDRLLRIVVTDFTMDAIDNPVLARVHEALVVGAQLPAVRMRSFSAAQLDTPTICIAEQCLVTCSVLCGLNDAAFFQQSGHPSSGITIDSFAREHLPFAPVTLIEREVLLMTRAIELAGVDVRGRGATGATAATDDADGAAAPGAAASGSMRTSPFPIVECTWHLAVMNGFLIRWRGTSSNVVVESARVALPAVAAVVNRISHHASFTYTPSDPYVLLVHQVLEFLDIVLQHTHLPSVVLEATLQIALDDAFIRVVRASMHNLFRSGDFYHAGGGLTGSASSPMNPFASSNNVSLEVTVFSTGNTPMATPAAGNLDGTTPPVQAVDGADAAALLTPHGSTFFWPDCPSVRKIARRLVLYAASLARYNITPQGMRQNDLTVAFCDPHNGPALHTLAAPVGASPYNQAVVLALLQSQLSGRKRAWAFLAPPRTSWAASFTRFLYLTFLQTYHSPAFAPNSAHIEVHARIAAAALKTLRLLLMWGTPECRVIAKRLKVVHTLAKEFDLEHNFDERRAQEQRRTAAAVTKFGSQSPTAADSKGAQDSSTASTSVPAEVAFAKALHARRDDDDLTDDDDDEGDADDRGPRRTSAAGAKQQQQQQQLQRPVVPKLVMTPGTPLADGLPAPAGSSTTTTSSNPASRPPAAPARTMPKIPKLSLGGSSLPLYFTSKGGDTGLAAEQAIFSKPTPSQTSGSGAPSSASSSHKASPAATTTVAPPPPAAAGKVSPPVADGPPPAGSSGSSSLAALRSPGPAPQSTTASCGSGDTRPPSPAPAGTTGSTAAAPPRASGRQMAVSIVESALASPESAPVGDEEIEGLKRNAAAASASSETTATLPAPEVRGPKALQLQPSDSSESLLKADGGTSSNESLGMRPPALTTTASDGPRSRSASAGPSSLPRTPLALLRKGAKHSAQVYMFDTPSSRPADQDHQAVQPLPGKANAGDDSDGLSDEPLNQTATSDVVGGAMELLNHSLYPAKVLEDEPSFLDLHRRFRRAYLSPAVHTELILCLLAGLLSPRGPIDPEYKDSYTLNAGKINLFFFMEAHVRHPRNAFLGDELRRAAASSGSAALHMLVMLLVPWDHFSERYDVGGTIGAGAYGNTHECTVRRSRFETSRDTNDDQPAADDPLHVASTTSTAAAAKCSAHHSFDDPDVAAAGCTRLVVKRVPVAQHAQDRVAIVQLHAEALAMAMTADLPGACRMVDVGNTGDHYCLVMPRYVENLLDWSQRLRTFGLTPAAFVRLILGRLLEVIDATAALHDKRIVHGDLKAENVLLDPYDRVALADFGDCEFVARADARALSKPPLMLGTETIRSPELVVPHQYNDRRKRQSSSARFLRDVWALGCLLYELVTGTMLFASDDTGEMIHRITHDDAPLLSKERARLMRQVIGTHSEAHLDIVTVHLEQLLQFTLVRDPARRPALRELRQRVEETLLKIPSSAAIRSIGLPPGSAAPPRPAGMGGETVSSMSWLSPDVARTLHWDIARADAHSRVLQPVRFDVVGGTSGGTHDPSRRGTDHGSAVLKSYGAAGSILGTGAGSAGHASASGGGGFEGRALRRCFGVVTVDVLLTATPGQPQLAPLSAVRATHFVSFVPPNAVVAASMSCYSLEPALFALHPMLERHDAAAANGYAATADHQQALGGSYDGDNGDPEEGDERAFAQEVQQAIDFISVAVMTRGTVVISSFIVNQFDMGIVLSLVYLAKAYGVPPAVSMPILNIAQLSVRKASALENLDNGLTVTLAERLLHLLAKPDFVPKLPGHIFAPMALADAPASPGTASSSSAAASPAAMAPRTPTVLSQTAYQCLCGAHQWRLPAEALPSNVVIDLPSSRLVPADVLPRWQFFGILANLSGLYGTEVAARLFEGNTVHVATVSPLDVEHIGVEFLVPDGPSVRARTDDDGTVVFCDQCGLPLQFLPAAGTEAGASFGLVMVCIVPAERPGTRPDLRVQSYYNRARHAMALSASIDTN